MKLKPRIEPAALLLLASFLFATACSSATPGDPSAKKEPSPGSTVAIVDGQPVTQAQLDEKAAPGLRQVRQQEYEIRKRALDEIINEQLLDKEAKAQSVTRDALVEKEITSKIPEPAQAEVDQVWEANKSRVGGKTKEQAAPDIVNFLKSQKSQEVQQQYLQSLRAKYKVQVSLEPPRVAMSADDDPAKGPSGALVTIVEFSDFQCPFCSKVEGTIKQVMEKYGEKVRFVYRDFPLSMHPQAQKASEAAQCAHDQGKFWEFHDALYGDQSKLAISDLEATAARLGLKAEEFKACLSSGKHAGEVSKDMADAEKAGVTSTPFFFINGIPLSGARDLDSFAQIIDQELARPGR